LPSVPVEWNEINAAWGQTALLLWCLAKKVGMEFQRYSLYPYGKVLPLYGSGGFKMIFDSKFDSAMVAFLDCLQQFGSEVTQRNVSFWKSFFLIKSNKYNHFQQPSKSFNLPYDMDKGKIKDNNSGTYYSIKLQFNSEDSW